MVKLFPFEGVIYNKKKLKKVNNLFTPPYDVISPEQQDALYNINDFNFVRLILGKEFSGDGDYNNKYIRAAAFLDGWLRHEILVKEPKPAFYAYEQRFKVAGKSFSRVGFIGLLRLEDMGRGKVYPHEETHSRAKIDRLQLMRATSADLEPIFCLYSDEKNKVVKTLKVFMKRQPLFESTDPNKVVHRLWRVDKKASIARVAKEMRDKAVFIADGHHRYEASLRFKNELKIKNTKFTEDESYNHVMVYFTPLEDKGLVVLPIHRALRDLPSFEPLRFQAQLEQFFEVKPYPATRKTQAQVLKKLLQEQEKLGRQKHVFILYLGNYRFFLLTLKDEKLVEELVDEEKPKAWKHLDTTILRAAVMEGLLNLRQESEDRLTYVKEAAEAVRLVDKAGYQAAFLLNPTRIEEIVSIAGKLEKMPQKSTYFYPKLLSGLVFYKIVHGDKVKL